MSRSLWLALALVTLGLVASLVPRVTYTLSSSGAPSGDVLVAWPDWGVEQDLGPLSGQVGHFHIWVSAAPGGAVVTVRAALVDVSTGQPVRQTSIDVTSALIPTQRSLIFPGYVVKDGQRLLLQLQVAPYESTYVVYGLAGPQPRLANPTLNRVPDAGSGPLAFDQVQTGFGLRAAIVGEQSERIRIALAAGFGVIAVAAHPRVARALRGAGNAARRLTRRPLIWTRRLERSGPAPDAGDAATPISGLLSVPWYPWPIAATPILHFLASNRLVFAASEAIFPLIVALTIVTGSVLSIRLILKDWHRPSAAVAAVTVIVFAYGHVQNALDERVNERVLFPAAVVLLAVVVGAAVRSNSTLARRTQFFNLVAVILLAFPLASLAGGTAASLGRASSAAAATVDDLTAHLFPSGLPITRDQRPDIYYIIFDEYARHDALGSFDNTDFLHGLERRGFYVASAATSNYMHSQQSIASILNMSYLDDLENRTPSRYEDLISLGRHHAVGAILKKLGYTYVHLTSGYTITDKAPLADVIVTFAPAGVRIGNEETGYGSTVSAESIFAGRFVRELIQTTALRPLLGHHVAPGNNALYAWWHPNRTLQMFDFLTRLIEVDGPKFVFAHIVKPHSPATFDRHGNAVLGINESDQFSNAHDPSVPDAYIGQLIFINSRILEMVDGILQNNREDPIIVITADHGRRSGAIPHAILTAFRLPGEGDHVLYPSISPVNQFRVIFDYYFGLDLGLLKDLQFEHHQNDIDFREVLTGSRA